MGLWPTYGDENPQRSWGGPSAPHFLTRGGKPAVQPAFFAAYSVQTKARSKAGLPPGLAAVQVARI